MFVLSLKISISQNHTCLAYFLIRAAKLKRFQVSCANLKWKQELGCCHHFKKLFASSGLKHYSEPKHHHIKKSKLKIPGIFLILIYTYFSVIGAGAVQNSTRTGFSVSSGAIPQLQIYNCNKQQLVLYSRGSPSVRKKIRFESTRSGFSVSSGAIPGLQIYNCNKQHLVAYSRGSAWVSKTKTGDTHCRMKHVGGVSIYVSLCLW